MKKKILKAPEIDYDRCEDILLNDLCLYIRKKYKYGDRWNKYFQLWQVAFLWSEEAKAFYAEAYETMLKHPETAQAAFEEIMK